MRILFICTANIFICMERCHIVEIQKRLSYVRWSRIYLFNEICFGEQTGLIDPTGNTGYMYHYALEKIQNGCAILAWKLEMMVNGSVAKFFALPVPVLHDKCETIAKVMTSPQASEFELYYNWQLMEKAGINNHDTLALAFVHELLHQVLYKTRFLLFENELWIQELAADMIVGVFSAIGSDVATGKYKYVMRQLPASMTHPDGKLRADIVEYGREYITQLRKQGEVDNIQEVLKGLPAFVYAHYQELQESWSKVQLDDDMEDISVEPMLIDYEALPDSNLIKQYYLKQKEKKKDDV